jgi:hypothetical protein
MSLETLTTAASIGTFLVIAATAIAAFVQLRHLRGSNSINALTECREVMESEEFGAAMRFVAYKLPELIKDPDVRRKLGQRPLVEQLRPITIVGNFFESLGGFVRCGIIDSDIACALWSGVVLSSWHRLAPTLAIMRRDAGSGLWEQFEYLAKKSDEWGRRHKDGIYPAGLARMPIKDEWLDVDTAAGGQEPKR